MEQQYLGYNPHLDDALIEELSLEVTNGSVRHKEYKAFPSQVDMVFKRFIREIKNDSSDIVG